MASRILPLILPLSLVATVAFAHGGVTDPTVKARMSLMGEVKEAMGVIGGMAKGNKPFDATLAATAKEDLVRAAQQIPAAFEVPASDPKSEALPEIWSDWDGFAAKAVAMEAAVAAVDTSSLEGLRGGLAGVGKSCGGCHKTYRMEK